MRIRTLLALAAAVVAPGLLVLPAGAGASSQYYSVVFMNKKPIRL